MKKIKLCSPAGNLSSLKEAIKRGADSVYVGIKGSSNIRNFPGLNLLPDELAEGVNFAHKKKREVFVAINAYPQYGELDSCFKAIDECYQLGVDGVILSDLGLLEYTHSHYTGLPIHASVHAGACNSASITFLQKHFDITTVVLPRVLTLEEIVEIRSHVSVELECFVLGILCINRSGLCYLSSYLTGESNNSQGACSPAKYLAFEENDRLRISLNGITLNEYGDECAAYPTPCKGRYRNLSSGKIEYLFQAPESLNILSLLPDLIEAGVDILKIEGRQRSRKYVIETTRILRKAIDAYYDNPTAFSVRKDWTLRLHSFFEGMEDTYGCYLRK
jgi:collagenase-like PrtC family protease